MMLQGYGTVRFSSKEEAEKAIEDFNGTELEGRALAVKVDKCVLSLHKSAPPLVIGVAAQQSQDC